MSERAPGRDLPFTAVIAVAALLPRLYVAIAWPREPVWDGHYYDFGARRIAAGLGYSDGTTSWHPWCHWPVGYSGLLAGVYRVAGAGPHVATVLNAIIGALLVATVHRLALAWLDTPRARGAAVLAAAYPGLVVYAALVMTEPLAALVLVASGWLLAREGERAKTLAPVLAGVLLGLGTLVRPTLVFGAPAVGLLRLDRARLGPSLRAGLLAGAIATACALLVVAPWTLRNCRVMDRCAFVSTNGGWNLAIGAFARATGRFETLRATDGCPVVTGQVQQDACWRDVGLRAIADDPARWIALIPKKLAYTFDHESFAIEYLREADPDRWPEARRVRGRGLLTAAHRVLLTLAAFAFVAIGARTPEERTGQRVRLAVALLATGLAWGLDANPFWLLPVATLITGLLPLPGAPAGGPVARWILVTLATTMATHAVLFGEDRYHLVLTPMLCVLAAAGLRSAAPVVAPAVSS